MAFNRQYHKNSLVVDRPEIRLLQKAAADQGTMVATTTHTDGLISDDEYQGAEEVLMPATEAPGLEASTLDAVQAGADTCRVTSSPFTMRAQRLGLIDKDEARAFMEALSKSS